MIVVGLCAVWFDDLICRDKLHIEKQCSEMLIVLLRLKRYSKQGFFQVDASLIKFSMPTTARVQQFRAECAEALPM